MSQENVEAFKRVFQAGDRRDVEAVLEALDPAVEWRPAMSVLLGGKATVYRGYEGVREYFRERAELLPAWHHDVSEIRDLGERVVAIGRVRVRGRESGAETESPFGYVVDFKDGKAIRIWSYLEPKEALEAAGLAE
jgi:ketosteroid isomerase-like protein